MLKNTATLENNIFPIITKAKQTDFEKSKISNFDDIPDICGYKGRGCRCMNEYANHMPCSSCPLAEYCK